MIAKKDGMHMNFGERLKAARNAKGLTQKQLADMIGVAKTTLTGYEIGNREPDFFKIVKLIDVLGVSSDYLLGVESHESNVSSWHSPLTTAYEKADMPIREAACRVLDIDYVDPRQAQEIKPTSINDVHPKRFQIAAYDGGTKTIDLTPEQEKIVRETFERMERGEL